MNKYSKGQRCSIMVTRKNYSELSNMIEVPCCIVDCILNPDVMTPQ